MAKTSFKREVLTQISHSMIAAGWTSHNSSFYRTLPFNRIIVVTLPSKQTTSLHSQSGIQFLPRIVVSDLHVESSYRMLLRETGPMMFPLAAGTMCFAPLWIEMNRPNFYKTAIPTEEADWGDGIPNDAIDLFAWSEFLNREFVDYHILKYSIPMSMNTLHDRIGKPKSTDYPVKTHEEISSEAENLCNRIRISASEVIDQTSESADSMANLAANCEDLNKAVLFGPNWPLKILFTLLLAGRSSEAYSFRNFLKDLKWWQLFEVDKAIAEHRVELLVSTFIDSKNHFRSSEKASESTIEEELVRLDSLIKAQKEKNSHTDLINYQVNYPSMGLIGLEAEIDEEFFAKRHTRNAE